MGKKSKPVSATATKESVQAANLSPAAESAINPSPVLETRLTTGWVPYLLMSVLGILLYANTFNHQYALDDELIVCGNTYVLKGMAGLGDIMTNDIFDSYNKSINADANLAGGRFRPFSVATFAIEQEFIGTLPEGIKDKSWDLNQNGVGDPNEDLNGDGLYNDKDVKTKGMGLRHVNNVLMYILSIGVLFHFLTRFFFREKRLLALIVCLLFLAHPIHTEVVANVKSRDEILSLMFMIFTMHTAFLHVETKQGKYAWWSAICFFVALLSKEYGATLLVILPVSIYVYFKQFSWGQAKQLFILLGVTFLIYFMMRSQLVAGFDASAKQDSELLNNPYMNATAVEAWATKIYVNLKYFLLMLLPLKLSSDYSFKTIAFRTFGSWDVWLSILLLLSLGVLALWSFRKRNWLVIPLLFILLPLLMVNNFLFNIGATMGERLVYHSSLGVVVLLVYGLYLLAVQLKQAKPERIGALLILPLLGFYSWKTIARNPAWKNNISLYTTDVRTYPESTMLNGNACISYLDLSNMPVNKSREKVLMDSAVFFGNRALALHPGYFYTHINLGLVKAKQGEMDSAAYHWMKARDLSPYEQSLPALLDNAAAHFYNLGVNALNAGNLDEAARNLQRSHAIKPKDHRPLYFLGMVAQKKQDFSAARNYWTEALKYAPGDQILQQALRELPMN